MDLFVKAGAKYFVGQAMHHDHFFNYPSKYNKFNSVEMGPGKDICGMWKKAAQKHSLPFGLTEHLGATFSWFSVNKWWDEDGPYAGVPYDGNDPEYKNFYFENKEHLKNDRNYLKARPWYTGNKKFHKYWLDVINEVIDMYQPDLLYSDGALPFGEMSISEVTDDVFKTGLLAVAHLYNTSIGKYGTNRAVYNQKDTREEVYRIGVMDIERSQLSEINPHPWQTDTCIGEWFYNVRTKYKKPVHLIEMLIDIVSKNGSLLLNILQKPDGTIDKETEYILQELASWFAVCGEAIYGTRPWRKFGEGDSRVLIDGFKEEKVTWNSTDFRFTKKNNTLYAFMLAIPENRVAVIKSLTVDEKVKYVSLLGVGKLEFSQTFGVLTVKLPQEMPTNYTNCLSIELDK